MTGRRPPPSTAWLDLDRLARTVPWDGWRRYARCAGKGPKAFFPEMGAPTTKARAYCDMCPARYACLAYGLEQGSSNDGGVWGGTSVEERRVIRRALARRGVA